MCLNCFSESWYDEGECGEKKALNFHNEFHSICTVLEEFLPLSANFFCNVPTCHRIQLGN